MRGGERGRATKVRFHVNGIRARVLRPHLLPVAPPHRLDTTGDDPSDKAQLHYCLKNLQPEDLTTNIHPTHLQVSDVSCFNTGIVFLVFALVYSSVEGEEGQSHHVTDTESFCSWAAGLDNNRRLLMAWLIFPLY